MMSRRIHVIRHVAFEDLGLWAESLARRGEIRYFQAGIDDLAECSEDPADLLVVLGGPIGVYEAEEYPFLPAELEMIRRRLETKTPLLGICLGAQLIAAAAGAKVYPSGVKEIGWAPIELTPAGQDSCLRHLIDTRLTVLHWHGDTFDLPEAATLLASTNLVKHQAFSIGRHALALQFHVEADPDQLESWLIGHTCELGGARIKPSELRRQALSLSPIHAERCERVLTDWLETVLR
jgi:GMP synthase (glutamine-hydrolysing)